ncbi:restriction endonuclease subunit S, partial [Mycoplasma zalophi]
VWFQENIENIADIKNGNSNTNEQNSTGKYPLFIRSQEVKKSDNYIFDAEAVITVGDGNIGKIFHYYKGKFNLHQRNYAIMNFKSVNAKYFYYYFSANFYNVVMQMSAKNTVNSVRLPMISKMNIFYPELKEQIKIFSFFDCINTGLSLL